MGSNDHTAPAEGSTRRQFWFNHIEACRKRGISLKDYAAEHELSVSAMYAAKSDMKRRAAKAPPHAESAGKRFVPVRVAPASAVRIHLPNGIVVEVPEAIDPQRLDALLSSVAVRS